MLRWRLTGTSGQIAIAQRAFEHIKFPFERLAQLPGTPELGWRDLNSGSYAIAAEGEDRGRAHEGHDDDGKDRPDPLVGELEGRRWTMGVIYTLSGRIYLDIRLEPYPELAMAVVAAEIAHAVDFFLPMTDNQRNELLRLWGRPGTTWWERFDYGAEYFSLGGEAFMHEFVAAYTDLHFGDKSSFLHDAGVEPADIRRVLGIERTDATPPAQPAPMPAPGPDLSKFKHFPGGPDIYHRLEHYGPNRGVPVTTLEGFRPCRVCRPDA